MSPFMYEEAFVAAVYSIARICDRVSSEALIGFNEVTPPTQENEPLNIAI